MGVCCFDFISEGRLAVSFGLFITCMELELSDIELVFVPIVTFVVFTVTASVLLGV